MRMFALMLVAVTAACSQPQQPQSEAPVSPPPAIAACNELSPDFARLVEVQNGDAVSAPAAELRGGRIAPGTYDLASASRIGGATGWSGARAVALGVSEGDDGVVLNWAGAAAAGETRDTWTATLRETPTRISYTCGRIGEVTAAFSAQPAALELRIQDGASGVLSMTFVRRP